MEGALPCGRASSWAVAGGKAGHGNPLPVRSADLAVSACPHGPASVDCRSQTFRKTPVTLSQSGPKHAKLALPAALPFNVGTQPCPN